MLKSFCYNTKIILIHFVNNTKLFFIVLTFTMMMQKQWCKEEKGKTLSSAQIKTVAPS